MDNNALIILETNLERITRALERIALTLERSSIATDQKVTIPESKVEPEQTPAPVQPEGKEQIPEPVQTEEPKPVITADQIRKLVVTLCAKDKAMKDAVREIVTAYGRNVSAIPADKYPEVMDRLSALQEG